MTKAAGRGRRLLPRTNSVLGDDPTTWALTTVKLTGVEQLPNSLHGDA